MLPLRPTRNCFALWAAVLALCLRLLLPGLHLHPAADAGAHGRSDVPGQPISGCACSEFRWPTEQATEQSVEQSTERAVEQAADMAPAADDADPPSASAAISAQATAPHVCFACDFELANPAAPPPAAMLPAQAPMRAAAPLVLSPQRCAVRCPSPPGRAPPTAA